jgi:hypothetical protein
MTFLSQNQETNCLPTPVVVSMGSFWSRLFLMASSSTVPSNFPNKQQTVFVLMQTVENACTPSSVKTCGGMMLSQETLKTERRNKPEHTSLHFFHFCYFSFLSFHFLSPNFAPKFDPK